ncbi:MAG TPA: RNA polymerase sigma factor [Ktedonobacterales bacterium]|nr:RNA polymerase sigma factor [Ktedonobacterales bacterium]
MAIAAAPVSAPDGRWLNRLRRTANTLGYNLAHTLARPLAKTLADRSAEALAEADPASQVSAPQDEQAPPTHVIIPAESPAPDPAPPPPRKERRSNDQAARIASYEAFFQRHEHDIFGYLWRLTGDEQLAYDLRQETFLRAWNHYDQLLAYHQPVAWLFRVATNLAINQLRRRKAPVGAAAPLDLVGDPGASDPSWRLVENDLVRQTLLALPPRQRAALVMREVYGFSAEEIARTLGVTPAAVRMTLWRGREQFRTLYTRANGAPRWSPTTSAAKRPSERSANPQATSIEANGAGEPSMHDTHSIEEAPQMGMAYPPDTFDTFQERSPEDEEGALLEHEPGFSHQSVGARLTEGGDV